MALSETSFFATRDKVYLAQRRTK